MALDEYVGKKIVLFYDDGRDVKRKEGIVKIITDSLLFLAENPNENSNEIAIPIDRIIRIEFGGNSHE